MARDIEEFLRRAAERRQQQKNQGQKPPPARPVRQPLPEIEVEIVDPRIADQPLRKKQNIRPGGAKQQKDFREQSVAEHVQQHLDTSRIAQHAEHLGDRIASVHDKVDQEIHRRLDHDVSKIDDLPTVTDDPRPGLVGGDVINPIAAELLKMLSNPTSIRQAILMSEILKVPDWEFNANDE